MASKTFQVNVITPEGPAYAGEAEFVVIPAHDGELGILRDRAPLVCKLGAGPMRIRAQAVEQTWFVDGGFCQVLENHVAVLTKAAIRAEDLDSAHAQSLLDEAGQMPAHDEAGARRKAQAQASALARLRMAR